MIETFHRFWPGMIILVAALLLPHCPLLGAPIILPGGTLYYSSQAEFETANPNLPKEDFEESPVTSGNSVTFAEPLNNVTNVAGAFAPGDILPGLTIQTDEGEHPADALIVAPANYWGNTSDAVGITYLADSLDILFSGNSVHAIGMDLMVHTDPAVTVTITLHGMGNTLLDSHIATLGSTPTFFGFHTQHPIRHVTATSIKGEIVDNIQFTRPFPWPMFLPGITSPQPAHR